MWKYKGNKLVNTKNKQKKKGYNHIKAYTINQVRPYIKNSNRFYTKNQKMQPDKPFLSQNNPKN